jgi:TonB-linked SusC/RagA family outer membrane protein
MKHKLWSALMLICLALNTWAQESIQVKGLVTDEDGKPLAAANVSINELGIGSATDVNGLYSFIVPAAKIREASVTLRVSYMGYRSQEVQISLEGREITRNFELEVDVLRMNEIVVTGFGPGIEKEKLGVTIAKVSGSDIVGSDEGNVVSAMHGKIANVEVTASSGEPGASSYIRIRGANSITGGTQPLFVVDGSPISNDQYFSDNTLGHDGVSEMNRASDINPEDIQSIEILKGPAASAIYGSRAANGVVLVTTKKGRPGRVRLSYKMSYSWDQVNKTAPLQTRWGQGVDGEYIEEMPWSFGPKLGPEIPVYDHENEMFETGHVFENNLAVTGGNERTAYYLSIGSYNQDGFIIGNSDYKKYSFRLNASQVITEILKVSGNFNYSNVASDRIQKGSNVSGLLIGAWRTPPDFDNRQYLSSEGYHRSYRLPNPTTEEGSRGYNNPFFVVNRDLNTSLVNRAFGNIQIDFDPLRWIHLNYTLGQDFSNDERRTVFPKGDSSYPDGRIAREMFNYSETDGHFTAEATRLFDPADLRVNLLLGHQWNQRLFAQFSVFGEGIGASGYDQLDNVNTSLPDEYQYRVRDESFFGVMSVDLFKQLYLSGSLRNDGSSTFGRSKKRHWYPKASIAWDFTSFKPVKPLKNVLSFGKLRAAYGEAGQQPDEYLWKTAYSTYIYSESYIQPNGGITPFAWGFPGFHSNWIKGNEDIRPQRTKEIETGIDLAFLDNRLGFGVTYYDSRTEDVIYNFPVAPSTGYNKNRVERLDGAEYIFLQGFETSCYAQEGYAMSVFRGTDFVRFGRDLVVTDAEGNRVNIDETYTGWKEGDLYIAEDGFPIEEPEDRVIGDPNPDWTAGIRNTLTLFDKLTISTLFDFKIGGDVYNGTRGALRYFGTHEETDIEEADLEGVVRRGKKHTFEGVGPGAGTQVFLDQDTWWAFGIGNSFGGPDEQFVEDGSYIKLREVAVSYKLKHPKLTYYTGLSDIDIRLSGRNLFTWTNYSGIDPETNISLNENWRGIDYFNHPQTRSFILTLRFNY